MLFRFDKRIWKRWFVYGEFSVYRSPRGKDLKEKQVVAEAEELLEGEDG